MPFYRLGAQGHNAAGDIFLFGVHVANPSGTTDEAASTWSDALNLMWNGVAAPADSIKQLFTTRLAIDLSFAVQLSDADGHQVQKVENTETLTGTSVDNDMPPQVAVAVSLRTGTPTRKGRGRFFLPSPSVVAGAADGTVDSAAQDAMSVAAAAALTLLNTAGYQPIVFHRDTVSGTDVLFVRVGSVFDTQRRRRNRVVESYIQTAI